MLNHIKSKIQSTLICHGKAGPKETLIRSELFRTSSEFLTWYPGRSWWNVHGLWWRLPWSNTISLTLVKKQPTKDAVFATWCNWNKTKKSMSLFIFLVGWMLAGCYRWSALLQCWSGRSQIWDHWGDSSTVGPVLVRCEEKETRPESKNYL